MLGSFNKPSDGIAVEDTLSDYELVVRDRLFFYPHRPAGHNPVIPAKAGIHY